MAAKGLSELAEVADQIARLSYARECATKDRDALIVELLAAGYSEREVALAAGVSHPRVHQIKEAANADRLHV